MGELLREILLVGFTAFEVRLISSLIDKYKCIQYVAATDNGDLAVRLYRAYHPYAVIINMDTPYGISGTKASIDLYKYDSNVKTVLIVPSPMFAREGMFLKLMLRDKIIKKHIHFRNQNPKKSFIYALREVLLL